jgi:translation elongation factor P/translation initiation factor 5A
MKTNELRIGNWVQYDGTPYQIESLTKVDAVVRR